MAAEKIIEKYTVSADMVEVEVHIMGGEGSIQSYRLVDPTCDFATRILLEEVRRAMVLEMAISTSEILDPKIVSILKDRFRSKAESVLKEKLPNVDDKAKTVLVGILLHDMVGLGKIEFILNDPDLEEIVVTSSHEPVRVYHKKYGWLQTNITIPSEDKIQDYSNIIARRVGRQITTLNPLLDAHLITGDRANAVLYPISTKGHTITIRKFARDPWTVTDLISSNTCSSSMFALIWLAIQYEMNIIISGGTASGKTTMLNVCMLFIPPNHRVISIEDTRELMLPEFLYWCPLTTRQPNPEGKGEVSMLDLLVNSLRMRPDRIVLGEIRTKQQAQVLFEAMHTGHSVYSTLHADSGHETINRLVNPPIEVPPNLLTAVNLNVVMFRDRRSGKRRTYQICEFLPTEKEEKLSIQPNVLYRWKPETDQLVPHQKSIRLMEDLSRHTGMSGQEFSQEINTKKEILDWMVKNKVRGLENVGQVFQKYYIDAESVIDAARKNKPFKPMERAERDGIQHA